MKSIDLLAKAASQKLQQNTTNFCTRRLFSPVLQLLSVDLCHLSYDHILHTPCSYSSCFFPTSLSSPKPSPSYSAMLPTLNTFSHTDYSRSSDRPAPTSDLGSAARHDYPTETKAFFSPLSETSRLWTSPLHGHGSGSPKVAQAAAPARPWKPVRGPDCGNIHQALLGDR